jgi:nicotinamidase/pyrazinamidase
MLSAMEEKKLLLIVDPQVDFITGTLPVPGAEQAMNDLARYIIDHDGDYHAKVVTGDWHPLDHCSFEPNGGQWPVHCVQHSPGAATWWPLLEALYSTRGATEFLTKGDDKSREEYSIMQNPDSGAFLTWLLAGKSKYTQVHVCGLAGDVCVLNTLRDLMPLCGSRIKVLEQYAPSLDGGKALSSFLAGR